ncbi:protein commissureless 2 [Stomoxys calcitrans]|uniref:Protein commissureless n=1 Tax=Stomoxys calcitrans TaxID=35570 RepID=A0A1I8PKM3_STOCA|nr:protein commissureless 2 [Stomoxys calcitrans]
MERIIRSLNYGLQFDQDAQHILENSHTPIIATPNSNVIALTSTPSIIGLDTSAHASAVIPSHTPTTTSDFLQKLGATIINSIQLQTAPLHTLASSASSSSSSSSSPLLTAEALGSDNMDFVGLSPQHVVIDSQSYDELQKIVEHDQLMNEVWIGIVLILILISMIFCFCSCFLYHQFRVWKRNYRTTMTQNEEEDNVKINLDIEDPVPEYTLVSGLPSYEAALELLRKNPQSCLIVHPSVFEIFNSKEKPNESPNSPPGSSPNNGSDRVTPSEASTPLLSEAIHKSPSALIMASLPSYQESMAAGISHASHHQPHSLTSISLVHEKPVQIYQSSEKSPKTNHKNSK